MRLVSNSVYNNASVIFPRLYECDNHFYINGKEYNKDFSLSNMNLSNLSLTSTYQKQINASIFLNGQSVDNVYDGEYNDTNIYCYNDGSQIIHSDDGTYYKIIKSYNTMYCHIARFDSEDNLIAQIHAQFGSEFDQIKDIKFIGQDDKYLYTTFISNRYADSYICYIPKDLSSGLTRVSSSYIRYSNNIQSIYENSAFIFIARAINKSGGLKLAKFKKTNPFEYTEYQTLLSHFGTNDNLEEISYGILNDYENDSIDLYNLTFNKSQRDDMFNINYRCVDIDLMEADHDTITTNESICTITNCNKEDIFYNHGLDLLAGRSVIMKLFIVKYKNNNLLNIYTCSNGYGSGNVSNSIITFNIVNKTELAYVGTTKLSSSATFPILSKNNVLYSLNHSGIAMYTIDSETLAFKYFKSIDIATNSIGLSSDDDLIILDRYYNIRLLNDITPYNVKVKMNTTSLTYVGLDIDTDVLVSVYNHIGNRISQKVKLSINGDGVFSNNSKVIEITTSASKDVSTKMTVKGSGKISINSTIIL